MEIERPIALTSELESSVLNAPAQIVPRRRRKLVERVANIAIAAVGIVIASPLMLLFALLVKMTSRGPILYSQPRVGLDRRRSARESNAYDRRTQDLGGVPFMIYKFRTMYMGAEPGNRAVWAKKNDSRVTPLGGFMRKLRIDELPQLFNVLKGDMNIVGPRPERPSIFSQLRVDIADYPLRQKAKPGITGWAQVNQSYDTSLDDVRRKVRYDLEYLSRQGLREDLRIMAKTVPVMLLRRGGW